MAEQKHTIDHKAIQTFAEEHKLKPARVKGTDEEGGIIRLMQPSSKQSESENLEEISWNEWFKAFENNELALIYQGGDSSFNKLIDRN